MEDGKKIKEANLSLDELYTYLTEKENSIKELLRELLSRYCYFIEYPDFERCLQESTNNLFR